MESGCGQRRFGPINQRGLELGPLLRGYMGLVGETVVDGGGRRRVGRGDFCGE